MKRLQTPGRGFTLIELMVTVALAAILALVAAPSLSAFKRNAELTSVTNSLVAALSTARSEALKRNYNVFVTTQTGNWQGGWVVFVDVNGNGVLDAATDIAISTQPALASYYGVTGGHLNSSNGQRYVMFNGSGFARQVGSSANAFSTITGGANTQVEIARTDLADNQVKFDQTRRIFVAITGRIRACKPKNSSDPECSS